MAGLFLYNRENFMFDAKQKLRREYRAQGFEVKLFEMYREDVRDLVDLTISKMDKYLIVNTLVCGFGVKLFTEGKPMRGLSPQWLHWLFAITDASSMMYFVLGIWLAMHASLAAHSFSVTVLTQAVRLPIPNEAKMDTVRAKATDYERQEVWDMFRIPVLAEQLNRLDDNMSSLVSDEGEETPAAGAGGAAGTAGATSAAERTQNETKTKFPIDMGCFRQAHANWQAYDAYARVCMALGMNQMVHCLGFYVLIMFVAENHALGPAVACMLTLSTCACLILRLDLQQTMLSVAVFHLASAALAVTATTIATASEFEGWQQLNKILILVLFVMHLSWVCVMVYFSKAEYSGTLALPSNFKSVLYVDVFDEYCSTPQERELSAIDIPVDLRRCQREVGEIEADIDRWEVHHGEEAASLLRQELREAVGKIDSLLEIDRVPLARDTASAADAQPPNVWLRLKCRDAAGRVSEYFKKSGEDEWKFDEPTEPGCVIIDFDSLRKRIYALNTRAVLCMKQWCRNKWHLLEDDLVRWGRNGGNNRNTRRLRQQFKPTIDRLAMAPELALGRAPPPGGVQPPAETWTRRRRPDGSSFIESPDSPGHVVDLETLRRQFQELEGPVQECFEPPPRRPPGQVPWKTFKHGSIVLIIVWLLGIVWCVLDLNGIDIQLRPVNPETSLSPELTLERVFAGPWPHPFFHPQDIACHPSLGPRAFVAETFAVHEIRLDTGDAAGLASEPAQRPTQPAFAGCIAQAADMQAAGFQGISVQCGPEEGGPLPDRRCDAVLLGTSGREALRCDVNATRTEATHMVIHGAGWRALTATDQGSFWAVDSRAQAVVELHQRDDAGASDELVPYRELPQDASNMTRMGAISSGAVLALEPGRRHLWAWHPDGSKPPARWRLPAGVRWSGLCATGGALYFVGVAVPDRAVSVWRSSMPPELSPEGLLTTA